MRRQRAGASCAIAAPRFPLQPQSRRDVTTPRRSRPFAARLVPRAVHSGVWKAPEAPKNQIMLWVIFALMSVAAVLAVLWPLARKPRAAAAGSDIVVYQDQLDEIGRDRAAGLLGEAEAEAARIEVSRRLLAAADIHRTAPTPSQPLWHRRTAAVAALIVVLMLPVGLYLTLGSPNIPGHPAFARTTVAPDHQSIVNLIGQVEQHLAKNPNDGAGWEVIAPVYMRLGRFNDAVTALRKSLALNGETATRDAALGEALVAAANGVVTDEAKQMFVRAAAKDPHESKARYFLGLADEQDGNREAAADKWRALLKDAPPGAPWVGFVREVFGARHRTACRSSRANRRTDGGSGKDARGAAGGDDPRHGDEIVHRVACERQRRRWLAAADACLCRARRPGQRQRRRR